MFNRRFFQRRHARSNTASSSERPLGKSSSRSSSCKSSKSCLFSQGRIASLLYAPCDNAFLEDLGVDIIFLLNISKVIGLIFWTIKLNILIKILNTVLMLH